MTTIIQPGEMTVVDYSVDPPVIVFDSDEKLLAGTEPGTGWIVGNITLPARTASITNGKSDQRQDVNINANYQIAAVNPLADFLLGGFKVTTAGGAQGLSGLGVYDAGGTYVHVQDGATDFSDPNTPNRIDVTTMATYTFFVSAGVIYLNERVFVSVSPNIINQTRTRTLLSVRFDFKFFVGTLT
jgi:hypothetical protein